MRLLRQIFPDLLTFLLRGEGHDLRVLIEVTWPRRLCHKKGANFIMSGYKYSLFALLPPTFFHPHTNFMCICIGLIKVMEKHESGCEKMLVREITV